MTAVLNVGYKKSQ